MLDASLLGASVLSSEKNRDKTLLEIINWRPWMYRGNDWRRILATIRGRKAAGVARTEIDAQLLDSATVAFNNAAQALGAGNKDAEEAEPVTARDKLHARCRQTLRTPRLVQTARTRRPPRPTTTVTVKQTTSPLFVLLNLTRVIMGSVLKQVQEANLLRTGTTRSVITIRRWRMAPAVFHTRKHSRVGSHCGLSLPKKESLWFGRTSGVTEQDIRFYADEAQEALLIFMGLCPRPSQAARPLLTRPQLKRFMHKNGVDMVRTAPFLDRFMDVVATNPQAIDAADYFALLSVLTKDVKHNRLQFAYMLYDLDNDGVVSSKDLFDLMRMDLHKLFPNDFRILSYLITDPDPLLPSPKTEDAHPVYLCLGEKAVEVRLADWLAKNRGRPHCDVLPALTRILYDQFRDASSPTNYSGLDAIGSNKRLTFTTKMFGTAHAISVFRHTAAVGNQLRATLEKTEATAIWSRDEVQVWLTMFWKASAGRNSIKRPDLIELLSVLEIDDTAGSYFQRVFDPDNTNAVTFDTFLATMGVMVRGDRYQILDLLFKMFDFDKNGMIRADEMFAVMECRWGQVIRDSLDSLLDAVVDKFNASADSDPTITNVYITREEYNRFMVDIPAFWSQMAQRIEQIMLARCNQMRRRQHAQLYSVHS